MYSINKVNENCDIQGKRRDSGKITITTVVSIVLDVQQDKRLPVEGPKIRADGKPAKKTSSALSVGGRQEQTSGWALTGFLKGYRAKRKILTSETRVRDVPFLVVGTRDFNTEGAKNTFNTLSTTYRSVIFYKFHCVRPCFTTLPASEHRVTSLGNSSKNIYKKKKKLFDSTLIADGKLGVFCLLRQFPKILLLVPRDKGEIII